MKHLFLLLMLSAFYLQASCQLSKNTWLTGGAASFYTYHGTYTSPTINQKNKYTNIDLSASIGYFFMDKLAGGIRPYFSSTKGEIIGVGSTNGYRLAAGPFARYYFLNTEKPFNILGDVSYQLGINRNLGVLHEKGKLNTFSVMAGTEVFFNSTAGLEILLGYVNKISTIDNSPNASTSNQKGFQISIGFQLHLQKF